MFFCLLCPFPFRGEFWGDFPMVCHAVFRVFDSNFIYVFHWFQRDLLGLKIIALHVAWI